MTIAQGKASFMITFATKPLLMKSLEYQQEVFLMSVSAMLIGYAC